MDILKKKWKYVVYGLIAIISFTMFMTFFHLTFNLDEEYSMGIIQHSYKQLININTLDVHPPTYYILLKAFLNVSTFWTKSFVIKIIFARILSLSMFIVLFIILHKIVKFAGVNIDWKIQLIFYLMIPSIGLYSLNIRAYDFYSLLICLEYYELLKFNKRSTFTSLFLIILYAIFASYIDYFSAVCAGFFIFIFFTKYLIKHNKIKSIEMFVSGIILLVSCVPLSHLALIQTSKRISYAPSPHSFRYILMSFCQNEDYISYTGSHSIVLWIIVFAFITPIIWAIYNMSCNFKEILYPPLIDYFLTMLIIIILILFTNVHVYEAKLLYPQFSIYSFLIVSVVIKMLNHKNFKIFSLIIILSIMILCFKATSFNIRNYFLPSYPYISELNKCGDLHKNFILNYNKVSNGDTVFDKPLYITSMSVDAKFNNRKIYIRHCKNLSNISKQLLNGNAELLTKTFNNLHVESKY